MALDYLTRQEVEVYYRDRQLPLDDNDNTNEDKITECINLIRAEIEPYLIEGGYKVPLTEQVEVNSIKHISYPLLDFYMNNDSGNRTRETITNYDYARSLLKKIANGDVNLPNIPQDKPSQDDLISVCLDIY